MFRHWERTNDAQGEHVIHPGLHWTDGVFFVRLADGYVQMCKHENAKDDAEVEFCVAIPPDEWASIVASVSLKGESEMFYLAKAVHEGRLLAGATVEPKPEQVEAQT